LPAHVFHRHRRRRETRLPRVGMRAWPEAIAAVLGLAGSAKLLPKGNPHCFGDGVREGYSYDTCCDTGKGPQGETRCWDGIMDFSYCCRPPAPLPQRGDPRCWKGFLQHMHEFCCLGSLHRHGPRGSEACWYNAEASGQRGLSAARCCDVVPARGAGGGALCLNAGHASTCAHRGVSFRPPTGFDALPADERPLELSRDPVVWPVPRPRGTLAPAAHLVTLGVGRFAAAPARLRSEALSLGVFGEVHAYTNFSWVAGREAEVWSRHMDAWREGRSRIAGFGWWKPVLCRRHLEAPALPHRSGVVVFSDAGSELEPVSARAWQEALVALQRFDVLAVVAPEYLERHYTKRAVLRRFAAALEQSSSLEDGQFITGLFALRKTPAALRLLEAWEALVQDVGLVNEEPDPLGEADYFITHRHEQSLWSLLLKCAILGRAIQVRQGGPLLNLSARVLILTSGYESSQLAKFSRRGD